MKQRILLTLLLTAFAGFTFAQDTANINPAKDNTLFEDVAGDLSSGQGTSVYAGTTGATGSEALRRGVFQFDLSGIPAGATIDKVTLRLSLEQGKGSGDMSLHKVTSDWGEGSSISPGGQGTQAQNNDATWVHTFYNASMWTTPGGDYEATASATRVVGTSPIKYDWSSDQMKADVEAWIADGATNFGWILIGDESTAQTAKKFGSKEHATEGMRPLLTVIYTDNTSGINKLASSDISIYPNPTNGKVNITINGSFGASTVEVIDLVGNVVTTTYITQSTSIDISAQPKGIYFVVIRNREATITKRVNKL